MHLVEYLKAYGSSVFGSGAAGSTGPANQIRPGKSILVGTIPLTLADDFTHLENPAPDGTWATQILAVGHIQGDMDLTRLHLDTKRFMDVTLDGTEISGRLFEELRCLYPADQSEWEYWLSEADGQIGWFAFEANLHLGPTQYQRHWRQGSAQMVPPVSLEETIDALPGQAIYGYPNKFVEHGCMLYSRTIADAPMPTVEYMLIDFLTVLSNEGEAIDRSIRVSAGMDLNPIDIQLV